MATYSGVYRIKNVNTGTFMAMISAEIGTSIVCIQADEGDKKALWRLVAVSDGKYKLRNLEHNLEAHTSQDFTMVGEPNGHSWFIRNGKGDERIITGNNNVVLELIRATNKLQLKLDKSRENQRWIIEPASDPDQRTEPQPPATGDCPVTPGIYVLKNAKTGTVMDLEHSAKGEGVKIFGFRPNGGDNQKWNVQPGDKAPNMTIRSVATDAYAAYPTIEQGANLRSNAKAHEYVITSADKGFHISPVQKPDCVLDLSGGGEANETEITLWPKNGMEHQKWYFESA